MPRRLENYLETFRKRMGLTQEEMAFLLGSKNGETVSRYERNRSQPGLKATLAYEVICRVPAHQLFAGVREEVEEETKHRARFLVQKLEKREQDRMTTHKLTMLKAVASEPGVQSDEDR